jgi:hypothetical protein
MLETTNVQLGNKSVYQLKNTREIHELLRVIKDIYGLSYPEKSYNDILFDEMLKRDTYMVPIYSNSIPVLIYMCYYHNNPCLFVILLNSLETIYIIPTVINIEYSKILLYGELIKGNQNVETTKIHYERILYMNNRITDYFKYLRHIELMNKLHNMLKIDWVSPKPIYHISEMEKLVEDSNDLVGIRFYSFKNPVIFYKRVKDLSKRNIRNIKLLQPKEHWITINNDMINNTPMPLFNIDKNREYILNIAMISYGIYKVYDNDNKDMGKLRLKTFEEHNELWSYLNKYKNIQLKLEYNDDFNKWTIPNGNIKDALIKAY